MNHRTVTPLVSLALALAATALLTAHAATPAPPAAKPAAAAGGGLPPWEPIPRVVAADSGAEDAVDRSCADPDSVECDVAFAVLAQELIDDMSDMNGLTRDETTPLVKAALAVDDPEVQDAALQLALRGFDPIPIGRELMPLLLSDRPRLRLLASQAAMRSTDPAIKKIGQDYPELRRGNPPDLSVTDANVDVAALGFKPYPGARYFPLGQAEHNTAVLTSDPVEKVVGFYKTAASPPMTMTEFVMAAQPQAAPSSSQDDEKSGQEMERLSKRMEAAMQKNDSEELKKISAEIQAVQKKQIDRMHAQFGVQSYMPRSLVQGGKMNDAARWVIVERKNGVVTRAVVAQPEALSGQTSVTYIWM